MFPIAVRVFVPAAVVVGMQGRSVAHDVAVVRDRTIIMMVMVVMMVVDGAGEVRVVDVRMEVARQDQDLQGHEQHGDGVSDSSHEQPNATSIIGLGATSP